jgi:hypothetical protein
MLTNKFKALLAANLKKHNLGKSIVTKVEALYATSQRRDNSEASNTTQATTTFW